MKIINKSNLLAVSVIFSLVANTCFAEVTVLQQQVLDDYTAMKDMSSQQRKDYRAILNKDKTKAERQVYNQAFKDVRAVLPEYLGVSTKQNNQSNKPDKQDKSLNKIAGSNITYDTGTSSGTAGLANQMLGNRFDSALHALNTTAPCCFPVENTGSITMITFDMVNTFFNSAVWSLYSNVSGTMADRVTRMGMGVTMGLNTVAVTQNYMNGSFLAGIFQFMTASTGIAVDTGTVGGQGFHAVSINDGTTGTMLTNVTTGGGGGLNAIFRVSGNVSTPVELINFKIE